MSDSTSRPENPYEAPRASIPPQARRGRRILATAIEMLMAVALAVPGILLAMAAVAKFPLFRPGGAYWMTLGIWMAFLVPIGWLAFRHASRS